MPVGIFDELLDELIQDIKRKPTTMAGKTGNPNLQGFEFESFENESEVGEAILRKIGLEDFTQSEEEDEEEDEDEFSSFFSAMETGNKALEGDPELRMKSSLMGGLDSILGTNLSATIFGDQNSSKIEQNQGGGASFGSGTEPAGPVKNNKSSSPKSGPLEEEDENLRGNTDTTSLLMALFGLG